METKICKVCRQLFEKPITRSSKRWADALYCGTTCSGKAKKGKTNHRLGKKNSKETRAKISQAVKGRYMEKASNWKGGRGKYSNGYVWVNINSKVTLEHRHIMALYIKRPLLQEERVHHINGIKEDNRIENLKLLPNESAHWHEDEKAGRHNLQGKRNKKI